MPASGPAASGGVTTSDPKIRNRLLPVPSETFPTVLTKIASVAARSVA